MAVNGINMGLGTMAKLPQAETGSIAKENICGGKGKAAMVLPAGEIQPEIAKIGQVAYWEKLGFQMIWGAAGTCRPSGRRCPARCSSANTPEPTIGKFEF